MWTSLSIIKQRDRPKNLFWVGLFYLERKTRLEPTMRGHSRAFFCHPRPPQGGMGSLVRAIVSNRRRKQKATYAGNSKVPQGQRLKGALCLARGWTMQVFRRKTAKQKTAPIGCCFLFRAENETRTRDPNLGKDCCSKV